jgi:uncharacterized DUF497 family protein
MQFEWDPEKARENLRKHGVSFETARLVFEDPLHRSIPQHVEGEERWLTMGVVTGMVVLIVAHTVRELEDGDEMYRIIHARKAKTRERIQYEQGH